MKKLLSSALALCMVFALSACGGGGDDPDSTPTADYDGSTPSDLLTTAEPTPTPVPEAITTLNIDGIHIISDGQITGVGYRGFTYEDGTLTIDSVTLERSDEDIPLIEFEGDALEIIVTGECSLTATGGASIISGGGEDITFSGDGTLTLSATDATAIDTTGSVTIGCALSAAGSDACASEDVTAADGWTLSDNGDTLTVTAAA